MTVIAGVVTPNGAVHLAADSLLTDAEGKIKSLHPKIWKVTTDDGNAMLLGWTGTQRTGQLACYHFKPPPADGPEMPYLTGPFVNKLREVLKEGGALTKNNECDTSEVQLLLGWRGRLFVISDWFCVTEHEEFVALGTGGAVAQAVLSVTRQHDARTSLELALKAAEKYAKGVRAPFHFLTLENAS